MAKPSRHGSTQRFVLSAVTQGVNPTRLATEDLLEQNNGSEITDKLLQESTELSTRWKSARLVKHIKEQIKITEAIRMKIDIVDAKFDGYRRMMETTGRPNAEYEAVLSELGEFEIEILAIGTELGLLGKYLKRLNS